MIDNYIKVDDIILKDKYTVEYRTIISDELKDYFKEDMFVKYEEDISDVPKSILIIPLLYNIAPVIWFLNATLIIDEVDETFYDSLINIKNVFKDMYKNIDIEGNQIINKVVKNNFKNLTKKSATLFSGGIDSWATYIRHIEEKPNMITVWGADVLLDDEKGWNLVKSSIDKIATEYDTESIYIKSNFKRFLNDEKLNKQFENYMNNWWVNVQHSIGLCGLSAPITYKREITKIYIPASYTEEFNKPWGSNPEIDNEIKWSNLKVEHDLYNLSRQEKINLLAEYIRKEQNKKKLDIRVCWEGRGGTNCCKCEKCCRSIIGLILAGLNPINHGFEIDKNIYKHIIFKFRKIQWVFTDDEVFMWNDLKRNIDLQYCDQTNLEFFRWLSNYDINSYEKKCKSLAGRIIRKICSYI